MAVPPQLLESRPLTVPSTIEQFRERARVLLPEAVWTYLEAGCNDGLGVSRAEAAWEPFALRPRVLRGVAGVSTATSVLGKGLALPVMLSPTGRATRFHPDGEREMLRGSAAAGSLYVLPSSVVPSLPALKDDTDSAPAWQQIYFVADRGFMRDGLALIRSSGCAAVVLTADLLPDGREAPPLPPKPAWEVAWESAMPSFTATTIDDLAWLCAEAGLPVVVKGVPRGDDARMAAETGAKGVIVSNHGGNQLDRAISSADALAEIVAACEGAAEVYVDGGIRRGASILAALALGARAVLIGRPGAYALAAAGANGVSDMLNGLKAEFARAMALCGVARVDEIEPSLVAPRG